jgi:vacuolar-type H+-ATPase subunit I/STV1
VPATLAPYRLPEANPGFGLSIKDRSTRSMKALFYVVFLVLSLPNLIVGLALLVLRHTFATWQPLEIVTSFLFQIVWGLPIAALLFVLLLIFGILSDTRPYAALFAFVLNTAALAFVLSRVGLPSHFDQALFFFPILLALVGFAWIAYPCFAPRATQK